MLPMTDSVKDKARGHWVHALTQLGVEPKHLGANKPCPACGGVDRFTFSDKDGRGTYFCRGCGFGDGFDLLQKLHGWDFARTAREVERVLGVPEKVKFASRPDPARALRAVYGGSRPVRSGDLVHQYLQARGLSLLPPSLRFHPSLAAEGRRWPAMLALVTDVTGKAQTLHRTFLDGSRKAPLEAPKKLMPPISTVTGSAIRLWPAESAVGLAEGIETAIGAYELFGIPTWACVSAGGLETVVLPESITTVHVYSDNDSHREFAGERAAYLLASRLAKEGRKVYVHISPLPNSDWLNELLLRRGRVAA